jgi:hypothetical protein
LRGDLRISIFVVPEFARKMEEPKKISFGFAKKSAINPKIKLPPVKAPTVEYISSLEGAQFETIG